MWYHKLCHTIYKRRKPQRLLQKCSKYDGFHIVFHCRKDVVETEDCLSSSLPRNDIQDAGVASVGIARILLKIIFLARLPKGVYI